MQLVIGVRPLCRFVAARVCIVFVDITGFRQLRVPGSEYSHQEPTEWPTVDLLSMPPASPPPPPPRPRAPSTTTTTTTTTTTAPPPTPILTLTTTATTTTKTVPAVTAPAARPKAKTKAHVNAKATPTVSGLYWCLLHVSYDDIDTATCQQQQEQQ